MKIYNDIQKIKDKFGIDYPIVFKYTKEELLELIILKQRIYEIENRKKQESELSDEIALGLCLMFFFFIKHFKNSVPYGYSENMLFNDYIPALDGYITDFLGLQLVYKSLFYKYRYNIAYIILSQQEFQLSKQTK